MRRLISNIRIAPFLSALFLTMNVHAADDLEPFPSAEEGYQRFVVRLPAVENLADLKVQLLLSKAVKIDEVNQYFFSGNMKKEIVEGWGYTYFKLTDVGPMAGTRMAVPADTPMIERQVPVRSELDLIPYNSKLPVVAYVPEGFNVHYRILTAGPLQDPHE